MILSNADLTFQDRIAPSLLMEMMLDASKENTTVEMGEFDNASPNGAQMTVVRSRHSNGAIVR
mgnify:CR=1 FL=1